MEGLSVALDRVLDDIGVCEENRKITRDRCLMYETIQTLWNDMKGMGYLSEYIFGSQAEATTTIGLQSDVDKLTCNESIPVVEDIANALQAGKSLVVVRKDNTPSGYIKLKVVENGIPCKTSPEKEGVFILDDDSVFLSNRIALYKPTLTRNEFVDSQSGPAVTTQVDGYMLDNVRTYRCKLWPAVASEWLEKTRSYNWPPLELTEKLKTLGYFVVPVGHPLSIDQDQEWRVSLSLQEKLLVQSFNIVQVKCYVLLKLIKKDIISKHVIGKSISSYHMKTCLFYLIENTPAYLWVPENLLKCLLMCLQRIIVCIEKKFCPNFFIPEENMFSRHFDSVVGAKLLPVLKDLVACEFQFLFELETDSVGDRIKSLLQNLRPGSAHENAKNATILKTATEKISICIWYSKLYLHETKTTDVNTCVESLTQLVTKIKSTKTMLEYTEEETKEGLHNVLSYIELSLLSNQIVQCLKEESNTNVKDLFSSKELNITKVHADYLTFKLKQAIFLYATNDKQCALNILIELKKESLVTVSNCVCRGLLSVRPLESEIIKKLSQLNLPTDEICRKAFSPCISFLPTVSDLLPSALRYEMIRSYGSPGTRDGYSDFWYDWAVVDGKFLLHFMLYMIYSDLNMKGHAYGEICAMKGIVLTDKHIGHQDTCLNMLGWVYQQEGAIEDAFNCFSESLLFQRYHNAATWHILFILANNYYGHR